ncbi:MAG: TIM barrel protein [Armatimonadota bacterium]|nr:TIM barrel protein [Armatimonadota bacterium]
MGSSSEKGLTRMERGVGLAIWNFAAGTLAQRIRRCAAEGFDFISLIGRDAASLSRGQCPDVEEALLETSLAVTIHAGMMSGCDLVPAEILLDDFKSFIDWHDRTGRLACVHYDAARSRGGEFLSSHMRQVLSEILECSAGAGVKVGVEDWPITQEQFAECEDLSRYEHFGLLIDLGHLNIRLRRRYGLDSPFPVDAARDFFRQLPLPVNELHLHNNNGERDQHAPLSNGNADMSTLARILAEAGTTCLATVEIVPAWSGIDEDQGWREACAAAGFWRQAFVRPIS